MHTRSPSGRAAITLIEIVVAVAAFGVLIGLLLPAVQSARDSAARLRSSNNLRQFGLAVHQYAEVHRGRLPAATGPIVNAHIAAAVTAGLVPSDWEQNYLKHGPRSLPAVPFFRSPADPSFHLSRASSIPASESGEPDDTWMDAHHTSYGANATALSDRASLTSHRDGLSNTLWLAEQYAVCTCGSGRTYWDTTSPGPVFAQKSSDDPSAGQVHPVTSIAAGRTQPSRPGASFQVRPLLRTCYGDSFLSEGERHCDPRTPQTPHPGGMLCGMGDGSVRTARPGIAPEVFWSAVTPAGGEAAGDW